MIFLKKTIYSSILFFLIFSNSNAEFFEIETISLNEKINLHVKNLKKTIINFDYPDKEYATIKLNKKDYNFKVYENIYLNFQWKDKEKKIVSINGTLETNNFKSCLNKKAKILNNIYATLENYIAEVKDNVITSSDSGMRMIADLVLLDNENIIRIKCYDYSKDKFSKDIPGADFLLSVNLTTRTYLNWLNNKALIINKKNKLNNFEIENYSINTSLLNYMSLDEINKFKKISMKNNSNHYAIQLFDNLNKYNELSLTFIKDDNEFMIKSIRGIKYFGKKDKCLSEKNKLFNFLLEFLNTSTDRALRLPFLKDQNSKNKSTYVISDYFLYINKDEINISCISKEKDPKTYFEVGAYSSKIRFN
jgi:hypothetical protein